MKKLVFTVIILFSSIISSTAYAQIFSIGVGGGLTNVVGSEDFTNDITDEGLGYSTEYNFGVIAKISLPLVPITPRAFILYHNLSGKDDLVTPLGKGSSILADELSVSQSVLSLGLGVQYGFIPIPAGIDPYLSFDLLYNNFGEIEAKSPSETLILDKSLSRFGLGLGVGAEVSIIPVLNIDLMVSYQMMNLVGKEDGESSLSTLTVDAFLLFSLL